MLDSISSYKGGTNDLIPIHSYHHKTRSGSRSTSTVLKVDWYIPCSARPLNAGFCAFTFAMLVRNWCSSRDGGNCAGCNAFFLGVLVANVNTSEQFFKNALGGTDLTRKKIITQTRRCTYLVLNHRNYRRHPLVDSHRLTNEAWSLLWWTWKWSRWTKIIRSYHDSNGANRERSS